MLEKIGNLLFTCTYSFAMFLGIQGVAVGLTNLAYGYERKCMHHVCIMHAYVMNVFLELM